MSKIDRNIDAYDRLMLRTSQLKECQDELTALRAWKAKATPFLEIHCDYITKLANISFQESNIIRYKEAIATLTELLGGSDE